MTNIDELLAVPVEGPLSQGDAALLIRYRDALREAQGENERMRPVFEAAIAIRTTPKCNCEPDKQDESCPAISLENRLNVAIDTAISEKTK